MRKRAASAAQASHAKASGETVRERSRALRAPASITSARPPPRSPPRRGRCARGKGVRRRSAPSARALFSPGSVKSRPPDVCGSKPRAATSSGVSPSSTAWAAKSRLRASPPVRTPCAAAARAPGRSGSASPSSARRTPLRSATSCAWPKSPKPVTSVAAEWLERRAAPRRRGRSAASCSAWSPRPPSSPSSPLAAAASTRPVPSGFVRNTSSPGRRRAVQPEPVGVRRADHREPVLRLGVADRVAAREDGTGLLRPWRPPRRRWRARSRPAAPPGRRRSRARGVAVRPWRRRRSARSRPRSAP